MKTTAVIVARFQVPYLHEGHVALLNSVKEKHNKVVIVLGVSPLKSSRRNPFDFYTRERMLKQFDPSLVVLPLKDMQSDISWSYQLDDLIQSSFPNEKFLLYGSRDSFIPNYHGRLQTEELTSQSDFSGTAVREEVSDKVMDSEHFRLGINYACQNQYTKVYPTVDIAVLRNDSTEILLGRKPNMNEWRLPGGFADATDISFEAAAQRELKEECVGIETDEMRYVASTLIDDWRYRSETDKIITTLFYTNYLSGEAKAGDDLQDVKWFNIASLQQMMTEKQIAEAHIVLIKLLLNKINN